jgi:hypothetical protein
MRLQDRHRRSPAWVERRPGEVEEAETGVEHGDEHQRPPRALPDREREAERGEDDEAGHRLAEQRAAVGDVCQRAGSLVGEPPVDVVLGPHRPP